MARSSARIRILSFLLFSISIFSSPAQVVLSEYAARYPNEKYVYLQNGEEVEITLDNKGEIQIRETYTEEVLYLDELAPNFAERHIPFSDLHKLEDYSAYAMIPNGSKYTKKNVSDFKLIDKYLTSNFYDDLKGYSFFFPSLQAGAISHLSYERLTTDPHLFGSYTFSRGVPVEKSVYQITFPSQVKIQISRYNCDKVNIKVDTIIKKGTTTYRFEINNLEGYPDYRGSRNSDYYVPQLLMSVVSYEKNGTTQRVIKDMKDFAEWHCSLTKNSDNTLPDALKSITDSIKAGNATEEDRVRAAYYWVQDHIRYISIQEGMGGYIPTSVKTCFQQRYGDCKAMSNLVKAMAEHMGIKAYAGLVGTRDIPYSLSEVPGTFMFNHMICMYKAPSGWKMLDATGRYAPYGSVPSFIQGKEVLILKENCEHEIYKVPIVSPVENYAYDSLRVRLDNKMLLGKGREIFAGENNVEMNHLILSFNSEEKDKYFLNHFKRGNNKCQIKNYDVRNLLDRKKKLEIDYEIELKDYTHNNEDEIIFNPHLKKELQSAQISDSSKMYDLDFANTGKYIFELILDIPEGYVLDYAPENKTFSHNDVSVSLEYVQHERTLLHRSTLSFNSLYITKEQFSKWNDIVKKLNKAYNESFVLKKAS